MLTRPLIHHSLHFKKHLLSPTAQSLAHPLEMQEEDASCPASLFASHHRTIMMFTVIYIHNIKFRKHQRTYRRNSIYQSPCYKCCFDVSLRLLYDFSLFAMAPVYFVFSH